MKLVIIEGPSCTGKSTLARKLASDLGMACFSKDEYKERQYDALPKAPSLGEWSQIESDSWGKMLAAVDEAVRNDTSQIIEGNFLKKYRVQLEPLIRSNTEVIEVFCYAKGTTILRRYIARNRSGERHKGHRDHLWYIFVALESVGLGFKHYRPLRLTDRLLEVDSTDFAAVNYEAIRAHIA